LRQQQATFWAIIEWQEAQCLARWRGGNLTASYSIFTGCMVEVGYVKVPEGAIQLRVNPHVIE
jgi:hypothetical protein